MKKTTLLGLFFLIGIPALIVSYNYLNYYAFFAPTEEVSIDRGNFSLVGTVIKPDEEGVFPAIIYYHGSGQGVRSYPEMRGFANEMVDRGFAVLIYDKRGSGASGGNFASALYSDFIDDALATIEYMRGRDDVDPGQIGIYVVSESGWFGPEIATRAGNLAFIINRASPTLSLIETVLFEMENEMLEAGFTGEEIERVLILRKQIWDYYKAAIEADDPLNPEREKMNRNLARLATEIGPDRIPLPAELIEYNRKRFQNIVSNIFYDPQPYLENLTVPQLYLFAGEDQNIPTYASKAYLEKLAEKTGRQYDIHIFPGVDHSFFTWRGLFTMGYPPGYLDLAGDFAERHVK